MIDGQAKLHMARALIMNPEILILEKPLMFLGDDEHKDHTDRGLGNDDLMLDLSRPPCSDFRYLKPPSMD